MSDDQRVPEPQPESDDESPAEFSFNNLTAEPIPMEFPGETSPSAPQEFTAPDHKATKRKWWQKRDKPETEKPTRQAKPKKPMPVVSASALRTGLVNFYHSAAFVIMPVKPEIAMTIFNNAEACADAWIEYSKTNPAIKRFLINLVSVSAGGALVMAHAPIIIALFMEFAPGMKEKQEQAMTDFVTRMSAGIPTTEEGEK